MYYTFSKLKLVSKINEYKSKIGDNVKNVVKSLPNKVVPKIKNGLLYATAIAVPLCAAAGSANSLVGNNMIYDNLPKKYQVAPKEFVQHIDYLQNSDNLPYYSGKDVIKDLYSEYIKKEGKPILERKINEAKNTDKTDFSYSPINFNMRDINSINDKLLFVDFAIYDPREFKQHKREFQKYNKQVNKEFKPIFRAEGIQKGYRGLKLMKYVNDQVKNGDAMSLDIYNEVQNLPKSKVGTLIKLKAEEMLNKDNLSSVKVAKSKMFLSKPYDIRRR